MNKATLIAERSRRRGRMELLLADLAAIEADYQPGEGEGKLAGELGKALWRTYGPQPLPEAAPAPESLQITGNPGPPEELKKVKPSGKK